jgi:hypothetical protein
MLFEKASVLLYKQIRNLIFFQGFLDHYGRIYLVVQEIGNHHVLYNGEIKLLIAIGKQLFRIIKGKLRGQSKRKN